MKALKQTLWLAMFCASCSVTNEQTYDHYIDNKDTPKSVRAIGCVGADTLSTDVTPVDIFAGVGQCIEQKKYKEGAELYLTALAYGQYDKARVLDLIAGEVLTALKVDTFSNLNPEDEQEFKFAVESRLGYADQKGEYCRLLKKLGPPVYIPNYMLDYGIKTPGIQSDLNNKVTSGMVKNFDSDKAWQKVMEDYANCSE